MVIGSYNRVKQISQVSRSRSSLSSLLAAAVGVGVGVGAGSVDASVPYFSVFLRLRGGGGVEWVGVGGVWRRRERDVRGHGGGVDEADRG